MAGGHGRERGVSQRRFEEEGVGDLVENAPRGGQGEVFGRAPGGGQPGVGGDASGEGGAVGAQAQQEPQCVRRLQLEFAEDSQARAGLVAGEDGGGRAGRVVVGTRGDRSLKVGGAVFQLGPRRQRSSATQRHFDLGARLGEPVLALQPERAEVLVLARAARRQPPRQAWPAQVVQSGDGEEVGTPIGAVDARVPGVFDPDADVIGLKEPEGLEASSVAVGPLSAAAEIAGAGDFVEFIPPARHAHEQPGVGARCGQAQPRRLRQVQVQTRRQGPDRGGYTEFAFGRLVDALEVRDRGERVPVLGPESARRKLDAPQLEGIEAAEGDGAVGVKTEGRDDRRAVEQHPRLGEVAAPHEQPRPFAHALHSREGLNRAEGIGPRRPGCTRLPVHRA